MMSPKDKYKHFITISKIVSQRQEIMQMKSGVWEEWSYGTTYQFEMIDDKMILRINDDYEQVFGNDEFAKLFNPNNKDLATEVTK